jgi:hypothetical protein
MPWPWLPETVKVGGHKTRVEPLATKIAPVSPPHGGPALLIRWEWNRFILRYQLAKLPVG